MGASRRRAGPGPSAASARCATFPPTSHALASRACLSCPLPCVGAHPCFVRGWGRICSLDLPAEWGHLIITHPAVPITCFRQSDNSWSRRFCDQVIDCRRRHLRRWARIRNLGADFELELRSSRRVSSMGGLWRLCAPGRAQVAPLSPPRPLPPLPPPPLGVHHRLLPRVQPRVFGVQVSCLLAEHLGQLVCQQQCRSRGVRRRGARPGVASERAAGPLCERVQQPISVAPPVWVCARARQVGRMPRTIPKSLECEGAPSRQPCPGLLCVCR